MNISQILTKLKSLVYSKSEADTLLSSKASSSHKHTKSEITDFPTIPSKTSQLTNDSGFLTSHQSLANYSTLANTVKSLAISGKTITVTPGSGNAYTLTTQDTVYTHPTTAGNKHIPSGGSANQYLKYSESGTAVWANLPTIPAKTSQLTNDSGYITSSGSCNYANYSGYVQGNNNSANAANALLRSGSGRTDSSPEGDTWIFLDELGGASAPWGFKHNQRANTIGFYGAGTETSSINLSNGYFSGSCNYANSAGNSDTLDSYHEYSFLRYRGNTSTSGEGTLWAQIGIKDYNNALPDGLSDVYQWGEVVSLAGGNGRFEIYCSHNSSNGNGLYYRSGWANDKKAWRRFIDSANIGSQSVNYANSAGSAGSVAWSNVSGRPTAVSQFTNDSEFWSPGGGKWNPNANISLPASGNGQEWSFDMHRNGKTGCYWHVWEDSLGTCLRVDADNGAVSIPKNILYLGGYKVYVG